MRKLILLFVAVTAALSLCACNVRTGGGGGEKAQRVSNAVIFVTFGGEDTLNGAECAAAVEEMNASATGVNAFFLAESLGRCDVESTYCGSVSVDEDADYYSAGGLFNRDGYSTEVRDGLTHVEGFYREQMLIRQVVERASFPDDFNPDADGDGIADGITLVLDHEFDRSASSERILWPHKSDFYELSAFSDHSFYVPDGFFEEVGCDVDEDFAIPQINGKRAGGYAVVSTLSTEGELCHELSHVLGLPDYYSYLSDRRYYDNIGGYDLLGAEVGQIPQYSLAYVRSKLGWLREGEDVVVTDRSGTFTLPPVTENGLQAIKIIPPNFEEKGEFFMVEARRKQEGCFDSEVNSTGVIIYSVVPEYAFIGSDGDYSASDYGNMYGNGRFEVKLFLGSSLVNYFTARQGNNCLEDVTYRDGTSAGVSITGITENADGSFTFDLGVEQRPQTEPFTKTARMANGSVLRLAWEPECDGTTHVMAVRATRQSSARFITKTLPNARSVARHDGEGLEVIVSASVSSLSRSYLPRVAEECYLLTVHESADGELYGYHTLHIRVEGKEPVSPQFGDFIQALMRPGKPLSVILVSLIACCVLVVLCVLVGIIIRRKRKERGGGAE